MVAEADVKKKAPSLFIRMFKTKIGLFIILPILIIAVLLGTHEVAVSYFAGYTCIVCHEMRDPIKRWKESGAATSHGSCADCHRDAGLKGVFKMNMEAVQLFVKHFQRNPNDPIKPPAEPLFLDLNKEPGYYSLVPNHRCFKCKDIKGHSPMDQRMVHSKLIKDPNSQPCKDCHNHEMRNGQKFYEKVIPKEEKTKSSR